MATNPVKAEQQKPDEDRAGELRRRLMEILSQKDAKRAYREGGKAAVAKLVLEAFREIREGGAAQEIPSRTAQELFLVTALQEAGVEVGSFDELMRKPDPRAVPVLIQFLPEVENRGLKFEVIRALGTRQGRGVAAPALVREFLRVPPDDWTLKWAIGDALSEVADDSVFDQIVQLASSKEHGRSREMVAVALGRMKDSRAVDVLIQLLEDEELSGHSVVALGKLRDPKALPHLKRFLNDPRTWVRKKAEHAIASIEKAQAKKRSKTGGAPQT